MLSTPWQDRLWDMNRSAARRKRPSILVVEHSEMAACSAQQIADSTPRRGTSGQMKNCDRMPASARCDDADLEFLAGLMDDRFRIPGTDIRFGLDSLVGLIPGIGDAIGGIASH